MIVNRQINERMRRHLSFPQVIDVSNVLVSPTLSKVPQETAEPRFVAAFAGKLTNTYGSNNIKNIYNVSTENVNFEALNKLADTSEELKESETQILYESNAAEDSANELSDEILELTADDDKVISMFVKSFDVAKNTPLYMDSPVILTESTYKDVKSDSILLKDKDSVVKKINKKIQDEEKSENSPQAGLSRPRKEVYPKDLSNNTVQMPEVLTFIELERSQDQSNLETTARLQSEKLDTFFHGKNVNLIQSNKYFQDLHNSDLNWGESKLQKTNANLNTYVLENEISFVEARLLINETISIEQWGKTKTGNLISIPSLIQSDDDVAVLTDTKSDSFLAKNQSHLDDRLRIQPPNKNKDQSLTDVTDALSLDKISSSSYDEINHDRGQNLKFSGLVQAFNQDDAFEYSEKQINQKNEIVLANLQERASLNISSIERGADGSPVIYDDEGNDIVVFNPPRFSQKRQQNVLSTQKDVQDSNLSLQNNDKAPESQEDPDQIISRGQLSDQLDPLSEFSSVERSEVASSTQTNSSEHNLENFREQYERYWAANLVFLPNNFNSSEISLINTTGDESSNQDVEFSVETDIDLNYQNLVPSADYKQRSSVSDPKMDVVSFSEAENTHKTVNLADSNLTPDAIDRVKKANSAEIFVSTMPLPQIKRSSKKVTKSNVPEKRPKMGDAQPIPEYSNDTPEFREMFEEMMMVRRIMAGLPAQSFKETNNVVDRGSELESEATRVIQPINTKQAFQTLVSTQQGKKVGHRSADQSQRSIDFLSSARQPEKTSLAKPAAIAQAFFAQLSTMYGVQINDVDANTNTANALVAGENATLDEVGAMPFGSTIDTTSEMKVVQQSTPDPNGQNTVFSDRNQRSSIHLSESARRFLMPFTGIDPNDVRIERNEQTQQITQTLQADALTVGDTILLSDRLMTETPEMLGLVAHELTHVARNRDARFVPPIARAAAAGQQDEEAIALQVESQVRSFVEADQKMRGISSVAENVANSRPTQSRGLTPEQQQTFGDMPAPWELPDWMQNSSLPIPNSTNTTTSVNVPAQPMPVIPAPMAEAPSYIQAAAQNRDVPAAPAVPSADLQKRPAENEAGAGAAPAPDLDELAQQVYRRLKRRIAEEQRRQSF
jgi:hypothetical protein